MSEHSNAERPYKTLRELIKDYGYKPEEIDKARAELRFVDEILKLKEEFEKTFEDSSEKGTVYSIQAPWGMGKTSFVHILLDEIYNSSKINNEHMCCYYYDSLFYGNVSEAITTAIQQLFKKIEKQYAIKLHGVQNLIAQNLTPSIEFNGLFAKLHITRKTTSDTGTLITERIRDKLTNIKGKIVIVIDDIDRLTSTEALHLLRMVRVLKEMPNTQILLPIDYEALVKMLAKEQVANPGGYVRKIITEPIRLRSSYKDLGIFFKKNFVAELDIKDETAADPFLENMWFGYLWELSLDSLTKLENRESVPVRLEMVMDGERSSPEWQKADILNGGDHRTNFVYDFFERTRRQYGGGTDYLVKFKVVGSSPELFHYYRYNRLAPNTTFDRFVEGRYDPYSTLGGGLEIIGGIDMFTMELYKESDVLELATLTQNTEADHYEVKSELATLIDAKKVDFWDLVSAIPLNMLPETILKYVSPRMIRRLIDELKRDKESTISETMQTPISTTNNIYSKVKDIIEIFVGEYASE